MEFKRITYILLCILFIPAATMAQDREVEARALYAKAEELYNAGNYRDALRRLEETEKALASTNSRILYLKINILNTLSKTDWSYIGQLRTALNKFFEITDKTKYPEEKYMDITNISLDLKDKERKYEADLAKTRDSNNPSDYENFFSNYPRSKAEAELRPKYNQLLEQRKIAAKKEADKEWRDRNLPLIKKYTSKGDGMVASGSILMGGGAGVLVYGTLWYVGKFGPGKYDVYYASSTNGYANGNWINQQGYNSNRLASIICMSAGSAAFLTGLIVTPIGAKFLKKSRKIKSDAHDHGIELASIAPCINPAANIYSCSINLKF